MCNTDTYLSLCCGSTWQKGTFDASYGIGICSKCLKKTTFWDEDDNKEYEDGNYYK